MHWQRLDRDTSTRIISSVASEAEAGLFSAATSEVTRAPLRFYSGYQLYKITNYASLPSFTFQYLSDGTFFHYLDGTEDPIYAVNAKGALQLDERTAIDYARFFLEQVGGEDGEERLLITDPHDMPLLESLGPDAFDMLSRDHRPPHVDYDGGLDAYVVEADLYTDGQVIRAHIEVKTNGRVAISHEKMTMMGLGDAGQDGYLV